MNDIEVKNLTKYYGTKRGIIDLTFNVKKGEIFGFIGPNGSGKSTTIRTLLQLIHQTSGQAKIFNKDSIKENVKIMENIGYLPAEVFYYDDMTVIELLNYSASFYKKDCTKKIKELSKIMELDLNRKIDELSYGNKKKVGIVQALLHEPQLLILDEPTGGLDPLMQHKFFDLLKKENEKGVTIFFSSHVLSEVQRICDRVGIIKEGKLIKIEDINIMNEKTYKKIKIETKNKIEENYFKIKGTKDISVKNNTHTFIFSGDINNILKKLVNIEIINILIEEPSLDEIFMHYYGNDVK